MVFYSYYWPHVVVWPTILWVCKRLRALKMHGNNLEKRKLLLCANVYFAQLKFETKMNIQRGNNW